MTPSERGRGSRSEISHSSKLLPGSGLAPTLRTIKFLVPPSTVRMKAGPPPGPCSTATYCAEAGGCGGAGVLTFRSALQPIWGAASADDRGGNVVFFGAHPALSGGFEGLRSHEPTPREIDRKRR